MLTAEVKCITNVDFLLRERTVAKGRLSHRLTTDGGRITASDLHTRLESPFQLPHHQPIMVKWGACCGRLCRGHWLAWQFKENEKAVALAFGSWTILYIVEVKENWMPPLFRVSEIEPQITNPQGSNVLLVFICLLEGSMPDVLESIGEV